MDANIWTQITENEYRAFWTTPQSSNPMSHPFSKTAGTLIFLLNLDSLPRKVTLLNAGPNAGSAQSAPADRGDENDEFEGMRMSIMDTKISFPCTLHFVSLFWEFDPLFPDLKTMIDSWSSLVGKFPQPDDSKWAVMTETLPALLLGNPNDPFWNLPGMCVGEKPRPFSLILLKTLLKRDNWDYEKCGKDIVDMFISGTVKKFIGLFEQACFPGSYGKATEKLLKFLHKELLSPGYHYRKSILSQAYMYHPETAHVDVPILIVSRQNPASNKLVSMARFWKNIVVSKPQILASLLSSSISNELGVPSTMLGLNYLKPDDLEKHFKAATKIYERSLKMKSADDADTFRHDSFERLYNLVIRDMQPEEQGPPCKLVPNTPIFNFNVFVDDPPKPGEMPSVGTPLNVPYSSSMLQLFREIVAKHKESRRGARVKIGVIGGYKLLQLVSGTFLFVCKELQVPAESVPMDFYLVPVEESSFVQEFARVDPWYRVHMCEALQYVAAVSPPFLFAKEAQQTLRHYDEFELRNQQQKRERRVAAENVSDVYAAAAAPQSPPAAVERILSSLFTDARVPFKLPTSLCLCWQMEGRFTVSLPFFAECRIFPQDRGAHPHGFAVALSYHLKHIDGNVSDLVTVSRTVTSIRVVQRWDLQDSLELVMAPTANDSVASLYSSSASSATSGGGGGSNSGGSGGNGGGSGSSVGISSSEVGVAGASSLGSSLSMTSGAGGSGVGGTGATAAAAGSLVMSSDGGPLARKESVAGMSLFRAEITAVDIKLERPANKPLVVILDKHQYGPFLKVRCMQSQYCMPCRKFVEVL